DSHRRAPRVHDVRGEAPAFAGYVGGSRVRAVHVGRDREVVASDAAPVFRCGAARRHARAGGASLVRRARLDDVAVAVEHVVQIGRARRAVAPHAAAVAAHAGEEAQATHAFAGRIAPDRGPTTA